MEADYIIGFYILYKTNCKMFTDKLLTNDSEQNLEQFLTHSSDGDHNSLHFRHQFKEQYTKAVRFNVQQL